MSSKIDESSIADNCEYCSSSFNIFKRKKICSICNQSFCQFCVSRLAQSTRTSGRICITCKNICAPESTVDELLKVKVRHLRAVLNSFNIPSNTCKEKRDLIDLFLRNRQKFNNGLTNRPNSHNTNTNTANSRETNNSNNNINMNNTNNSNTNSSNSSQQQQSYPFNETLNSFINNVQSFVSSNLGSVINPGPVPCPPPSTNPTQNRSNHNTSSSSASSTSSQNFNTMYNIFSEQMPNIFSNLNANPETSSQTTQSRSEPTRNPSQQSQSENQESKAETNIKRRASLSDLKTIEEIENLNIKQIKEILANNFVEYKGCCERNELVDKLKSLYVSYCQNKRKEQKINEPETHSNSMFNSEESDLCKICMESIMDCVLLECGHMCSCVKCGKQLAECPICRQNVVRVVRVFKS